MATALKSPWTERSREKPPKGTSVREPTEYSPEGPDGAGAWEEALADSAVIPFDLPFGLDPAEVRCPYCAGRCADDGWQEYDEPENLAEFQDFVDRLLDFDDEGWDGTDECWDGESEDSWRNDGETVWEKNGAENRGGKRARRILT